jgi:hypothetical protein
MSDGLNDAQKVLLLEALVKLEAARANAAEERVENLTVTVEALRLELRQSEVPF